MKKTYLWIHFGEDIGNTESLHPSVHYLQGDDYLEAMKFKSIYKDYEALILTGIDTSITEPLKVSDHINYSGVNPLMGKNHASLGPRFPDMSNAYSYNRLNSEVIAELKETLLCAGNLPGEEPVIRQDAIVYQSIVCNHQGVSPSGFLLASSKNIIEFINNILR